MISFFIRTKRQLCEEGVLLIGEKKAGGVAAQAGWVSCPHENVIVNELTSTWMSFPLLYPVSGLSAHKTDSPVFQSISPYESTSEPFPALSG